MGMPVLQGPSDQAWAFRLARVCVDAYHARVQVLRLLYPTQNLKQSKFPILHSND